MAVAKSGTCMTAARTPISDAEMPRPKSAMASGSPAATIEPKAMSSTMAAPSRPKPSGPPPPSAMRIGPPPSATVSPSPLERCARSMSLIPVASGMSHTRRSSSSVVAAIVRSGAMRIGPAAPMPSRRSAWARKRCTRARVCGACAPSEAFQTTLTVSPVRPGKCCASTVEACSDSEPLVAKSAWKVPFSSGLRARRRPGWPPRPGRRAHGGDARRRRAGQGGRGRCCWRSGGRS